MKRDTQLDMSKVEAAIKKQNERFPKRATDQNDTRTDWRGRRLATYKYTPW